MAGLWPAAGARIYAGRAVPAGGLYTRLQEYVLRRVYVCPSVAVCAPAAGHVCALMGPAALAPVRQPVCGRIPEVVNRAICFVSQAADVCFFRVCACGTAVFS